MTRAEPLTNRWVSLQKAADRLGVHPTTLRRWADDGQIPCTTTAGGHRRFALQDIDAFLGRQRPESGAAEWAALALTHARRDVAAQPDAHWLQSLNAEVRAQHRVVGRKLMGLTLQYVSTDTTDTRLLDEARLVGREYATLSKATGVPLRDVIEAALFFRDRLLEANWELPASLRTRGGADQKLDRRINALLNAVQLAIAEVYETP
jgi:excisionase family DNA binding protein